MSTIIWDDTFIHIPNAIVDHASFRRWVDSDDFPESGQICYLNGEVWIDLSREQLFSHNQLKAECLVVLGTLVRRDRLGRYFPEGVLLTHAAAGFTARPDGIFVTYASLQAERVRRVAGSSGGFVELEGAPEMVLEIVSNSSEVRDTAALRALYWQAGIREYWLMDAREEKDDLKEPLEFDILRYTAKGYVATRKPGGWIKSAVFGKSFKLTWQTDELGDPTYTLAVR